MNFLIKCIKDPGFNNTWDLGISKITFQSFIFNDGSSKTEGERFEAAAYAIVSSTFTVTTFIVVGVCEGLLLGA